MGRASRGRSMHVLDPEIDESNGNTDAGKTVSPYIGLKIVASD
jgi:hypothetical protein